MARAELFWLTSETRKSCNWELLQVPAVLLLQEAIVEVVPTKKRSASLLQPEVVVTFSTLSYDNSILFTGGTNLRDHFLQLIHAMLMAGTVWFGNL